MTSSSAFTAATFSSITSGFGVSFFKPKNDHALILTGSVGASKKERRFELISWVVGDFMLALCWATQVEVLVGALLESFGRTGSVREYLFAVD